MFRARSTLAVLALAASTLPGNVRGEGLTLTLEPEANAARRDSEVTGLTIREDSLDLTQRYRLALDRPIYPLLRVGAGGLYEWTRSWVGQRDAPRRESTAENWNAFARLDLGDSTRGANALYSRSERWLGLREAGQSSSTPAIEQEVAALSLNWRPADLPALELTGTRRADYDTSRASLDRTAYDARARLIYRPPGAEVSYDLSYSDARDGVRGTDTTNTTHLVRGTWAETFSERRVSFYVTGDASHSREDTSGAAGSNLERSQSPASGLSRIETFPDTPEHITLDANPALIDGDLSSGAGIDIGFGRSAAGDTRARDLGARFPDAITRVAEIHVWVDRRLAPGIAGAFTWSAYRSDDNVTWTAVPLGGAVLFDAAQNFFSIPISATAARYLKVGTRPLAVGVTTDPTFSEVRVTEIQFFDVVPITPGGLRVERDRARGSASTKVVLVRALNLAYDGFVNVNKLSGVPGVRWEVTNGLSLTRKLGRLWLLNARLERSDSDDGTAARTSHRATASLGASPLPTLDTQLSYSGAVDQSAGAMRTSNVVLASARADLFTGLSLNGQGSVGFATEERGPDSRTLGASAQATVAPHRTVTFTGSGNYLETRRQFAGGDVTVERAARLEGTASIAPVPAIYVSATVARQAFSRTSTQANGTVSLSPFRDGALQVRAIYLDSLDTAEERRTRSYGPSLRWNFSRRSWIDLSYSRTSNRTPAQRLDEQLLFGKLFVNLG